MTRWKLREPYFRGAETYKFSLKSESKTVEVELVVDDEGYFELEEAAPAGFYAFAQLAL